MVSSDSQRRLTLRSNIRRAKGPGSLPLRFQHHQLVGTHGDIGMIAGNNRGLRVPQRTQCMDTRESRVGKVQMKGPRNCRLIQQHEHNVPLRDRRNGFPMRGSLDTREDHPRIIDQQILLRAGLQHRMMRSQCNSP